MSTLATFANKSIPAGTFTTPAAAVPANVNGASLRMSRQNWPAGGVSLTLFFSYDGGATFPESIPNTIAAWVNDGTGKHPLSDAIIGFGWSSRRPTHVKARTFSPSTFVSTITIEAA